MVEKREAVKRECAQSISEHEPVHVHVRNGSGKAKFDVSEDVQLLESKGMKVQDLRKAQELAEENLETIRSKWHEYFD